MKSSIKRKTICILIIFAALICSSAIIVSYYQYSSTMDDVYEEISKSLASTAASQIDGDDLDQFLDVDADIEEMGLEKYQELREEQSQEYLDLYADKINSKYQEILDLLYDFRDNSNIEYIYIESPRVDEDGVARSYTIIDADEEGYPLGSWLPIAENAVVDLDHLEYGVDPFISNDEYGWLVTSSSPVFRTDGTVAAMISVDVSMDKVMAEKHHYLLIVSLLELFLCLLMIVAMIVFMDKNILNPIKAVANAARQFVQNQRTGGESDISKLVIKNHDEVGDLTNSLKSMEHSINDYITDLSAITAEKERIGTELSVATQIQATMLPCIFPAFPDRDEFDIYATMTPAKEVGGDFYDFYMVDDDHLAMTMADVSGKGIPAALFMAISKTMLKSRVQSGLSPKDAADVVNQQLCENNEAGMFVTVWLGIIELSTGKMTCINAGHEFPVIRKKDGDFELFKDKHGFVMGGMDMARYKEYEITLEPGDRFFIYTDGVPEATNGNDELYDASRMVESLNRHKDDNLQELLLNVKKDVDIFVGDAPQFDDLTMLVFDYKKYYKKD